MKQNLVGQFFDTVKKHSHCFNEQGRHFNGQKQDLARAIFLEKYPKKRDFLHQKVEINPYNYMAY